jgi:hypothetical protein
MSSGQPMPDLITLERKLKGGRQELRNLQHADASEPVGLEMKDLERSARAEVKLRVKALNQVVRQFEFSCSADTPQLAQKN